MYRMRPLCAGYSLTLTPPIHSLPFSDLLCAPRQLTSEDHKSGAPSLAEYQLVRPMEGSSYRSGDGTRDKLGHFFWFLSSCSDGGCALLWPHSCRYWESGTRGPPSCDTPTPHRIKHVKIYTLLTLCLILPINFWKGLYKFYNSDPETTFCILFIQVKLYCSCMTPCCSWAEWQ